MSFRYKKTILIALILALALVFYAWATSDKDEAEVIFLDVGQGDSILVTLPGQTQILIDGGPSDNVTTKLGRYIPFYDRKIELVILTHPHADHLRGINRVFERYDVENIMITGVEYDSGTYKEWFLDLLEKERTQVWLASRGDTVLWNQKEILKVLSPDEILLGRAVGDINQTSIVTELTLGGLTFFLQGDAEIEIENQLLKNGLTRDIDVLKVSHSGSRGGTSASFLNTILPEISVISVGKNSYGHPAAEVVERLETLGSRVLRTDQHGDIVWTFEVQ